MFINKYNDYIKDKNSFLFSLKSNGRMNGMNSFEIKSNIRTGTLCIW